MATRSVILRESRLAKLQAIKESGVNPYPVKFNRSQTLQDALGMLGKNVLVAGRLMSWREHGGSTFADLQDSTGQIQLFFKRDKLGEEKYKFLKNVDTGDFLGIEGEVITTQSGETTILVNNFEFLAKALRPLPSEWYGLKDVEDRYRKRYLDLILNPESKATFELRTKIIKSIREFLDERGFLEVETPTLQDIYGGASARPFKTHHNALDHDFFLKISDELYLKRLIVGGFEKVYEIDKDFRNEGIDRFHNPEFTMMECYQAFADYKDMMKLTEELYAYVAQKVLGTTKVQFGEHEIDLTPPWKRMTMKEAIKETASQGDYSIFKMV